MSFRHPGKCHWQASWLSSDENQNQASPPHSKGKPGRNVLVAGSFFSGRILAPSNSLTKPEAKVGRGGLLPQRTCCIQASLSLTFPLAACFEGFHKRGGRGGRWLWRRMGGSSSTLHSSALGTATQHRRQLWLHRAQA